MSMQTVCYVTTRTGTVSRRTVCCTRWTISSGGPREIKKRRLLSVATHLSCNNPIFLVCFPNFENIKVRLRYRHVFCEPVSPPVSAFERLIQFYETWCIRISWHLSPSQRRTSEIPPISLSACVSP
jgi:hypothetical protein